MWGRFQWITIHSDLQIVICIIRRGSSKNVSPAHCFPHLNSQQDISRFGNGSQMLHSLHGFSSWLRRHHQVSEIEKEKEVHWRNKAAGMLQIPRGQGWGRKGEEFKRNEAWLRWVKRGEDWQLQWDMEKLNKMDSCGKAKLRREWMERERKKTAEG